MRPLRHHNADGATPLAPSRSSGGSYLLLRSFLIFAALVFTGLGIWQVQRLFWKLDLIARVEARVKAPAVAPPPRPEWTSINADGFEYRHVTATGTFDHAGEALVQAVTERGPGFWVMTPLKLSDGTAILINRGFVPPEKRDPSTRIAGEIPGTVTVTGLLRISEPDGGFLRSNDSASGRWYSRDVTAIAAAGGVNDAAPYFIDADATPNPGGLPNGGLTVVQFRNSHLVYAITWFALAAMALGATIFVGRFRT
jgi:surfeit locus 1 family protein